MNSLDDDVVWIPVEDDTGFTRDEAYNFLAFPSVLTAAFWRSADHPRDNDGRFRNIKVSGNAVFDAIPSSTWDYTTPVGSIRGGKVKAALDLYGSGYFSTINGELRGKKGKVSKLTGKPGLEPSQIGSTEVLQSSVKDLDIAMAHSKLTEDVNVVRVIRDPSMVFGKTWKTDGDNTGLTWKDDGFISTTPDEDYARQYAGTGENVRLNLLVPAGTGALSLIQRDAGDAGDELRQVVLNRGLTFRVARDNGVINGLRQLDVEVRNG